MPDPSLQPRNDIVLGMTGSGKTTLIIRAMLNSNVACRFVFDDENRTAPRLRLKSCFTLAELEAALAGRWVIFNPSRMFSFDEKLDRDLMSPKKRAFKWFCGWVYEACGRGPGVKIVSLPEIWRFCTPDSIPGEFAMLMQMGRELNTHMMLDTQRPEMVNPSITGAATEMICFRLMSPEALKAVQKLGADPQEIASLPLGRFISYNRLTGGILRGRMF